MILLTAHRRENHGERLIDICRAAREIVRLRPRSWIVCPVHPNPEVQARMRAELGASESIQLIEPVDYPELLWLLDTCDIVLTDSGGLQEEAPAFGKPVLVLRDVTERPEGVDAGVARLVGTNRQSIVGHALQLLDDPAAYARMTAARNPYGDGRAAGRILDRLAAEWQARQPRAAAETA
jgi:UDP-N-acetylglucosamine 2-epimerase (non-hydrolysing)